MTEYEKLKKLNDELLDGGKTAQEILDELNLIALYNAIIEFGSEIKELKNFAQVLHNSYRGLYHDTSSLEINLNEVISRINDFEKFLKAIEEQKFSEFYHLKPDIENIDSRVVNLETRLKDLEEWTRKDEDRIYAKIKELEEKQNILLLDQNNLKNLLENLAEITGEDKDHICAELKELKRFQDITHAQYMSNEKKPHKCPVCDGSGNHKDQTPRLMVSVHTKTGIICCGSCEGTGIVWG